VTRNLIPSGLRFVTDAAINIGDGLDMMLPRSADASPLPRTNWPT
jgi:hypothetical protein